MGRTIAFFDVVGIKAAFATGNAAQLLTDFWSAADAWTNAGVESSPLLIPGTNSMQTPDLRVRTFSDSAVLTMHPEPSMEDFHRISLSLKATIERRALKCYVLIGHGDMVDAPEMPALGAHLMGSDMARAYENVIGSGETWVNVYLGDHCVAKTKEWHDRFSVYAVGDAAIPRGAKPHDSREFIGHMKRPVKVFALS